MTLCTANFLVARLAGFWGRRADGHPGPDLMGHGLMSLAQLVQWERIKKQTALRRPPSRGRKPGVRFKPPRAQGGVSSPGFRG
jgi:hypothetical protein